MRVFPEWRHGTAQGLQEHKSRAARARHEVTIESLTYKFIILGFHLINRFCLGTKPCTVYKLLLLSWRPHPSNLNTGIPFTALCVWPV